MNKLIFLLKRLPVIIVTGDGRKEAKETIFQVLKEHFRIGKNVLIFGVEDKELKNFEFFLKKSRMGILVITHIGTPPPEFEKDLFSGDKEKLKEAISLTKTLPAKTNLILNYDGETVREMREIGNLTNLQTLTFGFSKNADFSASDVKLNTGVNFKLNCKGNVIPIWLEKISEKEPIYASLAATAVGTILNLNLVEISESLKKYYSLKD